MIEVGKTLLTEGLVSSAKDLGLHPGRNVSQAPQRPLFTKRNHLEAKWKRERSVQADTWTPLGAYCNGLTKISRGLHCSSSSPWDAGDTMDLRYVRG